MDMLTCVHMEEIFVKVFVEDDRVNIEDRSLTREDSERCLDTVQGLAV